MSIAKPAFLLQIVNADDFAVVRIPAGGRLERDLVADITKAVVAKGVGFLKTEAQVKKAISTGIAEAFRDLKIETITVAQRHVGQ